MPLDRYGEANRSHWDETVALHAASDFYGVDRFLAGESKLLDLDRQSLGDVDGKSLLHLQCHFGLDTLSWAREGAVVTGLDFSPAAVTKARQLAAQTGIDARFVEADVYDAPTVISDRFDIVYVNVGALTWLSDVPAWARVCAEMLRPGGLLYVHDVHPMLFTLDDERSDQLVVRYPYFERSEPLRFEDDHDYAERTATFQHRERYEWPHSLSEIVSAVLAAGLTLDQLREHDWAVWPALPGMIEDPPGIWRIPANPLPLTFSLLAHKPANPPLASLPSFPP